MSPPNEKPATLDDVLRRAGVEYDHYKIKCIERRLAARMSARGAQNYDEYARVLQTDPAEAQRLAKALTINVSRFFRNSDAWRSLAEVVLPQLWEQHRPIRIWSAGCASGEEPYSAAALFHDFALRRGETARLNHVRILATDVDDDSLTLARAGVYPESALTETPAELRDRYFSVENGRATVSQELRAMVTFETRDLVLDREPEQQFDLILCRNVIIYLESRAQEALFERFHRCTRHGAFLMLGKVEAVLGRGRSWFRPVLIRARIYRRVSE